jgi:glyoxylase-like metal-dependent hydrolase (beta-lactamase superfamily II)
VQYGGPPDGELPDGQASDPAAWRDSLTRLHAMDPSRVHFCHYAEVLHSRRDRP